MTLTCLFVLLVGSYVIAAAVLDVREHRIPNYLTVPAALSGLLFHSLFPHFLFDGYPWGPLMSLAGFGLGFGLLLLPWLLGGGGMGDVKLLAALGAWLGPMMVLAAFGVSVLAAAVIAMITLFASSCTSGVAATKKKYLALGRRIGGQKRGISRILPFAVPVAVSTWGVLAYVVIQVMTNSGV